MNYEELNNFFKDAAREHEAQVVSMGGVEAVKEMHNRMVANLGGREGVLEMFEGWTNFDAQHWQECAEKIKRVYEIEKKPDNK